MERLALVITGLPASGKSTLGRIIADNLGFPLLDKDDFLQALFEARGFGSTGQRQKLSRESDGHFRAAAQNESRVVLVSHWRPRNSDSDSGTPVDWLGDDFDRIVEVFCDCPVDEACRRFVTRQRHPGHMDQERDPREIESWMRAYAAVLPLGLGELEVSAADMDQPGQNWLDRLRSYV